ncbi:MAG: limonene-1,2-epoxide hydrolase family protein [Candidatus Hydrogenedentota bacterium]
MSNWIPTVEALISAFNTKDIDAIMSFFTVDAVYHNMPTGPVKGTEAVRNVISMFIQPAEEVKWEILNIAQVGNTVLTERLDNFVIKGKPVALPVMGAFEMRDGKIAAWRDYFDFATWQKQNTR